VCAAVDSGNSFVGAEVGWGSYHGGVFEGVGGVGGEGDGGGEDEGSAEPSQGAEVLVEKEDAQQGADEWLHVEEDTGLGGGYLGHAPVPEQGGGGGAQQAAGGERGPGLPGDVVDGWEAVGEGDEDGQHEGSGGDAVGRHHDVAVREHQALVDEDPEEGDAEGENDEQVSREGGAAAAVMAGAKSDQAGSCGGEDEGRPAEGVEAFVGVDDCTDGEQDGHRADHQRGVRNRGEREALELEQELDGDAEEGGEKKGSPLGGVEAGAMRDEQREQAEGGEGEAVEDHRADVHLVEGDLAEEEAATPEAAGEGGGEEAQGAILVLRFDS
jgi:hypothetical protein